MSASVSTRVLSASQDYPERIMGKSINGLNVEGTSANDVAQYSQMVQSCIFTRVKKNSSRMERVHV